VPTPVCSYTYGIITVNDDDIFLSIINNTGATRTITAVNLPTWPGVPASQAVEGVLLQGTTIWTGIDTAPPTSITGPWIGALADRQLPNGATKTIQIDFRAAIQPGLIELQVTFDDGCVISRARP
jgi:hypothetical protein